MKNSDRLPIQVVIPRETDYSANSPGGKLSFLCEFTEELRSKIEKQCVDLHTFMDDSFKRFPNTPCIAKVVMKEKAIAKTHKPTALFKSNTCPIVGAEKIDELLVKVTPKGLDYLINTIKSASTKAIQASLTKIERIEPYSLADKIEIDQYDNITSFNQPIKIKLFSFEESVHSKYFIEGFEDLANQLGLSDKMKKLEYSTNLIIYKLSCEDKSIIQQILEYPGVSKVSFFPQYACDLPNIVNAQKQITSIPLPEEGASYPIVGIIDSGIAKGHKYLEPWIYQREIYVPEEYQNNDHGTFVAGILEYGNILNGTGKTQQHFKILDVVVIPNSDPEKGLTDFLTEDVLIETLYDVVSRYCKDVKVWNMSLGTCQVCGEIISDLAVVIDQIQDKYGVEFIIAAGNYTTRPLRAWPPVDNLSDADRITTPADSVRAISVGSIANIGIPGFVTENMPSPFSRKGPGANFLIKPDVVYYGGNCTNELVCKGTGVVSFDTSGSIVEDIGTSFAAPSITALYAAIRNGVIEDNSREYSKAFLIHSAEIPEPVKNQTTEYHKYFGYGLPQQSVEDIITCEKSSVTLIFSGKLYTGTFIEFNDFPFPKSLLKNGKWCGEIKMTLAYTPKLNPSYGQEYCRANIDAHFGTYDYINEEGNVQGFSSEVPLDKKWDKKYEKSRVENGFKWNPLKSYSRRFIKGIEARPWRLMIDSCARLGDDYDGQNFVLLITIIDPAKNDIYTEIIQMLRERGYIYNDVKLNNNIRQTIGL